jgi:uncharacterized protein YjiS (DUF1127 family)
MIITALLMKALRGVKDFVATRHTLFQLSRLSPRVLCDMGFDPADIAAVRNGEMRPAEPFRRRARRIALTEAEQQPRLLAQTKEAAAPKATACMPDLKPAQDICC